MRSHVHSNMRSHVNMTLNNGITVYFWLSLKILLALPTCCILESLKSVCMNLNVNNGLPAYAVLFADLLYFKFGKKSTKHSANYSVNNDNKKVSYEALVQWGHTTVEGHMLYKHVAESFVKRKVFKLICRCNKSVRRIAAIRGKT